MRLWILSYNLSNFFLRRFFLMIWTFSDKNINALPNPVISSWWTFRLKNNSFFDFFRISDIQSFELFRIDLKANDAFRSATFLLSFTFSCCCKWKSWFFDWVNGCGSVVDGNCDSFLGEAVSVLCSEGFWFGFWHSSNESDFLVLYCLI